MVLPIAYRNPFFAMKYAKILGLITLGLILTACNSPSKDTTSPDNRLFLNRFFKLRIEKPSTWHSMSNERMTELDEGNIVYVNGKPAVLGKKKFTPEQAEARKRTTRLFTFFGKDPDRAIGFNPSLMGIAEEVPFLARGSVKTGCNYLQISGKNLAKGEIPIALKGDCISRTINGKTFGMVNGEISVNGTKMKQRYLATMQKSHAIIMVQTFDTPEDEAALEKIAATISFKK
jgi:hypothetical protein